jgi:hypothetical protein
LEGRSMRGRLSSVTRFLVMVGCAIIRMVGVKVSPEFALVFRCEKRFGKRQRTDLFITVVRGYEVMVTGV